MYTVSILSQTSQQWRTLQVASLSEAVQLTLGLETSWYVQGFEDCFPVYVGSMNCTQSDKAFGNKYKHAVRSLVAKWKNKYYDNVLCYRMSDSDLLAYHHSIDPSKVW